MRSVRGDKSQAEIAESLGVHAQFISNVERGVCAPSLNMLKHYKRHDKDLPRYVAAIIFASTLRSI